MVLGAIRSTASSTLRGSSAALRGSTLKFSTALLLSCLVTGLSGGAFCAGSRSPSRDSRKSGKSNQAKVMVMQDGLANISGNKYPKHVVEQSEKFLVNQGIESIDMIKLLCPEDVDIIPSTELSLGCKALIREVFAHSGGRSLGQKKKSQGEVSLPVDIDNMTFDQGKRVT